MSSEPAHTNNSPPATERSPAGVRVHSWATLAYLVTPMSHNLGLQCPTLCQAMELPVYLTELHTSENFLGPDIFFFNKSRKKQTNKLALAEVLKH
jgi:hypothetical protein